MLRSRIHRPRLTRARAAAVAFGMVLVALVPAPAHPTSPRVGIDTADRAAVLDAWQTMVESRAGTSAHWSGRRNGCRAGSPSAESTRTILDGINFARGLAGLTPVRFSRTLSAKAQQAALIMAANGTLSHDVPRVWKCWSRAGAAAASKSNLYYGWHELKPEQIVPGYLSEPGDSNVLAGHRRWILNPAATAFGNGLTNTSHALYVIGPTASHNANPSWVPWPTAGWFPSDLEPSGRWSLASGSAKADFARAHVKVERDGTPLKVQRHRFVRGYGMPTITWDMQGATAVGTYTVTVSGIRGAAASRISYTVRIFETEPTT